MRAVKYVSYYEAITLVLSKIQLWIYAILLSLILSPVLLDSLVA